MLNQSYEPLSLCNAKKAIILLFLDKVELVAASQKVINTSSKKYPLPSVIRLKNYAKIPYRKIILTRKNILKRDGNRCAYCGKTNVTLTLDHIIPKSKGGDDSWENLITSCLSCNNKKGNLSLEQANMQLRIKPYRPDHLMLLKNELENLEDTWKPFLFE